MRILLAATATNPLQDWIGSLLDPASSLRSTIDLFVAAIAIVGAIIGVISFIRSLWKKTLLPHRVYKEFVDSMYSKENREAITKYYIPTRAQDIDPCDQDEIRENNGNFISQSLIPFFCNDAFKESSQGKYYLVLADSGMGKTTFLLRLFRECLLNRSLRKRLNVKLIPLSLENCLQMITKTPNQENTILLLDALDENNCAINDYDSFFTELLNATERFNKIVITCRTQFFPDRASEPVETGRIRVGTGKKREEIIKKYISPFSDEEVKQYLKKLYRFNRKKQEAAYRIVSKVPALMARPVILNWINFLCDATDEFQYAYQIYNTIIDKWIEREDIGHTNRSLFDLSRAIAEHMYQSESTSMSADIVEQIAAQKDIQLEPIIAKSRSLLNRNGSGDYKFAHRSFLEFFIVFGIFEKMQMPQNLTFLFNLSGVKKFLFEILVDTAQKAHPDTFEKCICVFQQVQSYIQAESFMDFLNRKDVVFNVTNLEDGFKIHARLNLKESEKYDPRSIFFISDQSFLDISQKGKIIFRQESITLVDLCFTCMPGDRYPDTLMAMQIEYATNRVNT